MDLYAYQFKQVTLITQTRLPLSFVGIQGQFVRDIGYNNYPNMGTSFLITLNGEGRGHVDNTRLPAQWNFTFLSGPCINQTYAEIVDVNDTAVLACQVGPHIHPFSFNPATADALAMPSSFTTSGEGIDGTYGMPMLEFYDEYGRLVATTFATSVGTDGQVTWLTGDMPSLLYTCSYVVGVSNVLSDGSFELLGATSVDVINGQELPPLPDPTPTPDPGPCGEDPQKDCNIY
jgi:hypothetical protein